MKKLIYTLLALSMIFTACKKEEGCTDAIATNYNADAEDDDNSCIYSIIGVWTPNSMTVNASQTVTVEDIVVQSFDTAYTITPQDTSWNLQGNIEFTNNGSVITTNDYGEIETDSYTTSGSSLTITDSDDGSIDNATYIVTKTNLAFTMSDTETETEMGTTYSSTYDMTFNSTRQ